MDLPAHAPRRLRLAALLALATAPALPAATFVYEGRLEDHGRAAEGRYDIRLTPHAAPGSTLPTSAPITFDGVPVSAGRFRLEFDMPGADGGAIEFGLAIRDADTSGTFTALPGRTKAVAAALIGACWSATGDSGSNPAVNFLGTTDAQPLVLRTANAASLRIEPSSLSFGTPPLPITTNSIGGSHANGVTPGVRGATIAGGGTPEGNSDPGFTSEAPNLVTDSYGVVGGGVNNRAGNDVGTQSDAAFATIAGGSINTAGAFGASVGGGIGNIAEGNFDTVAGGTGNDARGLASTVTGGQFNCAGGNFSQAGGRRAKVRPGSSASPNNVCEGVPNSGDADGDEGSFVWADSQDADFVSTAPDQFMVRTSGGAVFTANSGTSGPAGNRLRVDGTLRVDALGSAGSTSLCRNSANQLASCSSSARYKHAIADLELGLAAVLRLRAVGYRWKTSGEADVGFVAEEVAAIDERLVTRNARGDIEGVKYDRISALLANAVQDLAARERLHDEAIRAQATHSDALQRRLRTVEAANAELRARLADLEQRVELRQGGR